MMRRRYLYYLLALLFSPLLLNACGGKPAKRQTAAHDQQWQSNMQTGLSAYEQGQYQLAGRLFEQALQRGRQMDRADDIADAAFNLAAAEIQLGNFAVAGSALQEAKNESQRRGDDLSETLLMEARLARLQTDSAKARNLTHQLLQQLPATDRRLRPQALLLSGLLACEAKDLSLAKRQLETAASQLDQYPHPAVAADRAELQGCLHLLQGHPLEAAGAFDRESSYLRQARQYRQMVNALHEAGTTYTAAGEYQLAADRLYRAARSAFSQKRLQKAQMLMEIAEENARSANSSLLLEDITRLRAEITNSKQSPQ